MKIDQKYIELINKEIDGLITKEEKVDLLDYLSRNNDAKQYYAEMIQTSDILNAVKDIEPPPNLKIHVKNSLDESLYKKVKKKSIFQSITLEKFALPKLKFAFTFSLGVIAGLFIYAAFFNNFYQKQPLDSKKLHGTIGVSEDVFEEINSIKIEKSGISGSVVLKQASNLFTFNNNISSENEFSVIFKFNPQQLTFKNFIQNDLEEYTIKKGLEYFQVECNGQNNFSVNFLLLAEHSTNIKYRLLKSGNVLFEQEMILFQRK